MMKKTKKFFSLAFVCVLIAATLTSCQWVTDFFDKDKNNIYDVEFVYPDGSEYAVLRVRHKDKVVLTPKKEGYTFEEYYYFDDPGRVFDIKNTKITGNIKIIVKFTANEYTLTVVTSPFGTPSLQSGTYKTDEIVSLAAEGDNFVGWYNGDIFISLGNPSDALRMPPYNITLKAVYADGANIGESVFPAIGFDSGEGSQENPYVVTNAEELSFFASYIGRGESNGEYFSLLADIDLKGADWTPIGTVAAPFKGVFDGNGHKISNFGFSASAAYADYGLFGYAENAEIKNLGVSDVRFTVNGAQSGTVSAGAVAGRAVGIKMSKVFSAGVIDVLSAGADLYAGGLIGKAEGTDTHALITDSYSTVRLYAAIENAAENSKLYAGGLIGYTDFDVSKVYAAGNVYAAGENGNAYVSGLIGLLNGSLETAFATGDVSVSGGMPLFAKAAYIAVPGENAPSDYLANGVCRVYGQKIKESERTTIYDGGANTLAVWFGTPELYNKIVKLDAEVWDLDYLTGTDGKAFEERGILPKLRF
ncbi:MAG: hypothetical protein LBP62_01805 [Clostridiales bacterium]|jgi:hypothetical protein|nr:hypothetical protein [Clostridiales bacterium]